jgi:hypothetical protein
MDASLCPNMFNFTVKLIKVFLHFCITICAMSLSRPLKIILGVIAFIFVAIQFIPVNRNNPPVKQEINWDSPQTKALAERACGDCHSNNTKWPAYSYVAPVSLFIQHEINEGRQKINFSEWGARRISRDLGNEIEENVKNGSMPTPQYLLLHPEARLTDAEKAQLIEGLKKSIER